MRGVTTMSRFNAPWEPCHTPGIEILPTPAWQLGYFPRAAKYHGEWKFSMGDRPVVPIVNKELRGEER